MKRDSFIFYRSFFEATEPLSQEQKASLYDAICKYSLEHEEITLDPICTAMFGLIKPQLDANYIRYSNGKKGGKPKQNITKAKPKANQKLTKAEPNVNVNVNVNDNVNEKKIHTRFNHLRLSVEEFNKLKKDYNEKQIKEILEQIENFKGNTKYKSLYLTAKQWLKRSKDGTKENNKPTSFDQSRTFGISL